VRFKLPVLFGIGATFALFPSVTSACECLSGPNPSRWNSAPYVFIGTVTVRSSSETRIVVDRQFRGPEIKELLLPPREFVIDDCEFVLRQGAPYLIRTEVRDVRRFSTCDPPIPLAEASEELKYLEGMLAARRQAFLYGFIRAQKQNGEPDTVPSDPITVVVDTGQDGILRQPIRRNPVLPGLVNFYQLVVPPGSHRVWLERDGDGSRITAPQVVEVENGSTVRRDLRYSLVQ
jgi:hypothetical protein